MKRIFYFLALLSPFALQAQTPSTLERVYEIFQANCTTCHNNASPEAGLDLEGVGATEAERILDVYNNLVDVSPANAYAAGQGYDYIYPGRPDKSFLFRKVSHDLDPLIELHTDAGAAMPKDADPISDVEKELIRQWILFGARINTVDVDEALLVDYYENGIGAAAFDTPPPAPDPSEGFQVRMGPFFLHNGGEVGDEREYFLKYETDLAEALEVYRIDVKISPYSHHFILNKFDSPATAANVSDGYRLEGYHTGITLVAAVQEETDLLLPEGAAFPWDEDLVLELNSHYINYSVAEVYKAEAYLNIYTQPAGEAAQEMHTALIPNFNIPIPNNGDLITYSDIINDNFGEMYLWGVMGHTHGYGAGYKVYKRENFFPTDLIYDASCPLGVPGCVSPYYDYQHIPMRYFEPLLPITMNSPNGLVHEASWINNGPEPVSYGPTSDDEMMVVIVMFTEDTTGLVFTGTKDFPQELPGVTAFPNPAQDELHFHFPVGEVSIQLYDAYGKAVLQIPGVTGERYSVNLSDLPIGMYHYQVKDTEGRIAVGKVVVGP